MTTEQDWNRAMAEAGYAPVADYVRRYEAVEPGGCAPPVLIEREPRRRWREHGAARHTAILLLIVLAVMALVTGGR